MQKLQNIVTRAIVRLAIVVAPADTADQLRQLLGGGGPRPVKPV